LSHHQAAGKISRRQFTAGSLALGAAALCRANATPAAANPASAACTFGFGTYGMKSLTTEEAIRTIADIGFDSVMLDSNKGWDAEPGNLSAARRAEIKKLLKDRGLRLPLLEDDLHPDHDDKKNAMQEDHLKALAQMGHDLSPDAPPVIETMVGGSAEWTKIKPVFLKRLESWAKIAESSDVTIAIKAHAATSMYKVEQAVELFRELGSPPRLKLCYDYSHFVFTEMTMKQTIETALPWTVSVVMKDAVMVDGKRAFKLPGESGLIDYPALLRQFYAGGYRGDFNCEISAMIWKKPGYDPIATAKQCYANIAPAFIAAGVPRMGRK
jgi:inosose dehydratase